MSQITLEIVTPRGRALIASVDEVTAPSVGGEFGVLPGHLPLLASLRAGIVTYKQGGEAKRCAVGAGFAEAGPDKLVILTDEFIERPRIDPVVVRKDLAEVQKKLAGLEGALRVEPDAKGADPKELQTFQEVKRLVTRENWLAAQLELYGDPPPATMRPFEEYGPPPPPDEDEIPKPDDSAPAERGGKD
jgi:F-type H+-transporting ATPase subunit epsilon